jgi:cell division protein YceG involved in septum cleavage
LRRLERVRRLSEEQQRQAFTTAEARLREAEEELARQRRSLRGLMQSGRAAVAKDAREERLLALAQAGLANEAVKHMQAVREDRSAEVEPARVALLASCVEREQTTQLAEQAAALRLSEAARVEQLLADEWFAARLSRRE